MDFKDYNSAIEILSTHLYIKINERLILDLKEIENLFSYTFEFVLDELYELELSPVDIKNILNNSIWVDDIGFFEGLNVLERKEEEAKNAYIIDVVESVYQLLENQFEDTLKVLYRIVELEDKDSEVGKYMYKKIEVIENVL